MTVIILNYLDKNNKNTYKSSIPIGFFGIINLSISIFFYSLIVRDAGSTVKKSKEFKFKLNMGVFMQCLPAGYHPMACCKLLIFHIPVHQCNS